jgi:hypothetical protein
LRRYYAKKVWIIVTGILSVGVVLSQVLGSGNPTDNQILAIRIQEGGAGGSGIFDIPVPPSGTQLRPVQRVPRDQYGEVGPFPLQLSDLNALVYPDTTLQERQQMLEGMSLFTLAHTAAEGAGPMANQPFCLGCHQSSAESLPHPGLVSRSEWFSPRADVRARYDFLYNIEQLEPWVDRIRKISGETRDTYVVTNNHNLGKATVNAFELQALFGKRINPPAQLVQAYPELEQLARQGAGLKAYGSPGVYLASATHAIPWDRGQAAGPDSPRH